MCAHSRGCTIGELIRSRAFDSHGPGLRGDPRSRADSKPHLPLICTGAPSRFGAGAGVGPTHALLME